jgi:dihydroorotate dehydrogenase (fumarate)
MARIGTIDMSVPVMNAACSVAKSAHDIAALAATNIGGVTIGTITVEPREGNPEPRWYAGDGFALNSFGMPGGGIEYYREHLPEFTALLHDNGKLVSVSIGGFSVGEYVQLAEMVDETAVDFIELNLSCPNVQIDGKQKPIASFDLEYMKTVIEAVCAVTKKPLFTKLSPYSNPAELARAAATIANMNQVAAVVTSNTFANGYFSEDSAPVVAVEYAGVSGRSLLPIALGQVRQFRKALPESIAVIGVGGIESTADAEQYYAAGASAVQVATLIVRDGHGAINKVVA